MYGGRLRRLLPDGLIRCAAWLCLLLVLYPTIGAAAATTAVPVVTNIAGAVALRSPGGSSRDIFSSQLVHSGDLLMTGVDSLAVVNLADVGRVRLGPGTTTTTATSGTNLTFAIAAGSMCAEAEHPAISIQSGALTISAATDGTIFDLSKDASGTKLAVFQGQVTTQLSGKPATTLKTGQAVATTHDGTPAPVPFESIATTFAVLHCPDDSIVAQAMAPPGPTPAPSSGGGGGGGGGILGILLGIAGLAALAGHGGGGGGGGGGPQPNPSVLPSPSATPGALMVNPNSLSFSALGSANNKTFDATENHYTGPISAASDNTAVATVSPASGAGPGVTFTVTPVGAGTAHVMVTDNHGGSQTVTLNVGLAPGPLMASPNNLLFTALGPTNAQPFTASEANYSGQISVTIDHPTVATVTPPSGSGPSANFTVTPLTAGTAQITVTDDHGGSTAVTVNVAPPGALAVTPGNLTFDSTSAASQTFDASETNYNRSIFTSGCAAVATVSPGTGTGPDQTFSVSPKAAGSCMLTVFDDHGGSQTVAITVFGPLNVGPATLNFNGTTNAKNITAQETAYSGQFTTSGCSGIVTITPSTGTGPSATLSVKPVSSGSCTITVSDDHGNSSPVGVTVSAGALSANPNALTFTSASAGGQQFTASETNFTGAFNVSGCSGIVSVAPNPGAGPSQIFTVSPTAKGSCTLTVSDGTNTATVDVTVFGAINLTPNTLSFSGTTSPQTLTAQEDFYAGAFTLTDPTCAGIVTVTGGGNGPTQHYTVTPVAAGSCSVRVQDNHGGFDTSTVTVSTGTIGVAPGSLTFNSASAASQNVTATENDYAGPFNVSGCSGIVTVAPNPGTGPSQLFTVSPVAPGSCTLTVSDDHSGSGVVSITVFGSLQLVPGSLTFGDVGAASAQHFAIDEANFTGTFSVDASACSGIASIDAGPFTGPSASVTVTPQNSGSCSISVSDGHGGTAPESVTVGPFGAIVPSSASLTFSDVGSAANQSFTVSESGYSGVFTIDTSACAGVATVSPASGTSSTSFVVTPVAAGGPCSLHVSDDHGSTTANVSVTVGPFGSLAPSTASLQFNDVGPTITQTFTVSESGYTGSLTLNESACAGIASVNPTSGSTSTTFTVTSVGAGGPCSLSISDDHGSPNATVSVTVGPFGPVSPSPGSVSLTVGGANGSFSVSETGYAGTFTADASSCGSAASVSPASGTSFTVTPGTTAGNCAISVSDDHGQSAKVNVFVTSGAMTVDTASLQFSTPPAPTQTFTATSPSAALITITSAPDPLVATVSPASGTGPSVTFTVAPVGNGRTSLTVSDGLGGQAVVSIGVGMAPLAKTRHPLATRKPLPKQSPHMAPGPRVKLPPLINRPVRPIGQPSPLGSPGQPGGGSRGAYGTLATGALSVVFRNGFVQQSLAVFELNYAGTISVSSSDPNVVTVANPLLRGPNALLMIVPHHAGVAVIRLADDHGGVREISVLVQAAAIRPPGVHPVNPPGHPPTNP